MIFTLSRRAIPHAFTGALLLAILGAARPAHAEVITFFNFNDADFASDGGTRSSTITTNFLSNGTTSGDIVTNTNNGSTINADPDGSGPFPASAAGTNLSVYNTNSAGSSANQGRYIQFGLNTTGYTGLNVSFATANLNTGFNSNQFQYSLNGTTFTTFATYVPTTTNYGLQSFDLSSVTGLNNNANAVFRITFGGGSTTSTQARNDLDNISVSGINVGTTATPEPETWAMMVLGVVMMGGLTWRRKKQEPQLAPTFDGLIA